MLNDTTPFDTLTSTFRENTSQNERSRRMSKNKMKLLSALYPNYDLPLLSQFPFDAYHPFTVPRKFLESTLDQLD